MGAVNLLPLALGLIIFSFLITSILVIPFIDFLYRLHFIRKKEAPKRGKIPLFDKLHDQKAGTPVGGGILLIIVISFLFLILFPFISRMGVFIQCAYELKMELIIIFFTFLSFGLLGLSDDLLKIFGKPSKGIFGMWFGLRRRQKFILEWILALIIGFLIYRGLGVSLVHLPMINKTLNLGIGYIPFSAFIIVMFSNAFNITDGLDGLATGLLVICLISFAVIVAGNLDTPLSIFITIWLGALIAFLYFNVWPARIFLGDAGALSFGATLSVISLITGIIVALMVIWNFCYRDSLVGDSNYRLESF